MLAVETASARQPSNDLLVRGADYVAPVEKAAEKPAVKTNLRWLPYQSKAAPEKQGPVVERVIPASAFAPVKPSDTAKAGDTANSGDAGTDMPPDDPSPLAGVPADPLPPAARPAAPNDSDYRAEPALTAPKAESSLSPLQWRPAGASPQPAPSPTLAGEPAEGASKPADRDQPAVKRAELSEKCLSPKEVLRAINTITNDIGADTGEFPPECPVVEENAAPTGPNGERIAGTWRPITFTWTASALCHRPLYFEQIQVERYGHTWGPYVQPVLSAAHFFVAVPILPYLMGVDPPGECQYSLGYYRPGSCAPYMLDPFPISVRGALFEGMAWTGAAFIF